MNDALEEILHGNHSRGDKCIALLFALDRPAPPADIRALAVEHGLREISTWNVTDILSRTNGDAVPTPSGWRLSKAGLGRADALGLSRKSQQVTSALANLRREISQVGSVEARAFLEEAITCVEGSCFRAAVIMSWVAAVHVLQETVVKRHLDAFNAEARNREREWRSAKNEDDLARIGEAQFLEILVKIGALQRNTKAELKSCLDRRNACGHPNSYKLSELTVAHHVEVLVLNVFSQF